MASSGRVRHRDREPGSRRTEEPVTPAKDRVFRITEEQRQSMADALRRIDEAREQLETQQKRENRQIIRDLKTAADHIFDVLSELEET
jgi:DNA-binding PadR family transcriptional regulator